MGNAMNNYGERVMSSSSRIASEREAFDALVLKMSDQDIKFYYAFGRDKPSGHNEPHACFIDRVFYIYQCQGKDQHGMQRSPKVEAVVRVINMAFTLDRGMEVTLLNETTNQKQIIGAVPARAFGFPVFVSVPCSTALRWNLITDDDEGIERWEPAIGLYIKTANEAKFFSRGNHYMQPPKSMVKLYPGIDWRPEKFEHQLDRQ